MTPFLDSEILHKLEMAALLDRIWNQNRITPTHITVPDPLWGEVLQIDFPVPSPLFRADRSPYEQALTQAACKAQTGGVERFHIEVPPARVTVRESATAASADLVEGEWKLIFRLLDDRPPRRYRVTQLTQTQYHVQY